MITDEEYDARQVRKQRGLRAIMGVVAVVTAVGIVLPLLTSMT